MKANNEYQEKLKGGHSTDQTMFSLSWDIEELYSKGRSIHHEMLTCMEHCVPGLFGHHNNASKLKSI